MKRLLSHQGAVALVALALAAAAGGTAFAAEPAEEPAFRPPLLVAPAPPAATSPALQVAIDPETGLFRPPTPGQRIELAALARETAGLRRVAAASETVHADGTISLALDPALHSLSTVTVGADGSLHFACGDAGEASHLHAVAPAAPAAEDR